MKELQAILRSQKRISANGETAVLATVVAVKGSSYRLPGAKMLISETAGNVGTISGGCLEADVLERAKWILKTNAAEVLTYDTTANDDSVFALNMGCRGVIRILLESISNNDYFSFVENCFETRQSAVVATVIQTTEQTKLKIGSRFYVSETTTRNDFQIKLEKLIFADALEAIKNNRSRCKSYENGATEIFLEVIKPPLNLIVFGAGADAVSLVETAKNLGWRVSVVDHRAAFATAARFPCADEIFLSRAENLDLEIDENSAAIVMTHNYERDKTILSFLLKSRARYIGALGPKPRIESILGELKMAGENFAENDLQKLFAPVGLDIGADAPETIALSIVAEIQTVFSGRAGGFLRERQGSIYNR